MIIYPKSFFSQQANEAVADIASEAPEVLGMIPPTLRKPSSENEKRVSGDARSNLKYPAYILDMVNNGTMFAPKVAEGIAKRAGSMAPVARAVFNPTYFGSKSLKVNLPAGLAVGGLAMYGESVADDVRTTADGIKRDIDLARYHGRYDLADRMKKKHNAYSTGADDISTLSNAGATGSIGGGRGVGVGLVAGLAVNAFRRAMGGTQDSSLDDGFHSKYKSTFDDRILAAFEQGRPDGSDPAKMEEFNGLVDSYYEQLRRVGTGGAAVSTIDPRIQTVINKKFPKLGSIYGEMANPERLEEESKELKRLESDYPEIDSKANEAFLRSKGRRKSNSPEPLAPTKRKKLY